MTPCLLIRRLHQHRQWANHRLLATAETLTETQLRRPFEIGQGSVWRTLLHLYAAEYVWLAALEGNESPVAPGDLPGKLPGNQQGDRPIENLAALIAHWRELDQRWEHYLAALTDAELDKTIWKVSTSSGAGARHPTQVSDVLLHVCTHAQYTTAQGVNMLRHAGAENLPDVMLISLARQGASARPS